MNDDVNDKLDGIDETLEHQREEVETPPKPERPVTFVTMDQFVYAGLVLGVVLAILGCAVAYVIWHGGNEQDDADATKQHQIDDNTARVNDLAVVVETLNAVVNRLNAVTNPTPDQFRRQLREGVRRCLAEPDCRRLVPGVENLRKAPPPTSSTNSTSSPQRPSTTSRPKPDRQPSSSTPTRPKRPAPQTPSSQPTPAPSSPSPPPSTPPERPKPVIGIETPLLPLHVCAGAVVSLNCHALSRPVAGA